MPALSLSDIADRRYRLAGHQAGDAGLVSRRASAGSRQEGPVQHRTGSPARDLDQRRIQHKLMQAMIERDRRYRLGAAGPRIEIDDAYIGGERTGEGAGRGRRGQTPFIIAVETSSDGRLLYTRLQVVR